ncbi:MAG: hemerythrin family protein [Rhodospirillales bacterium]|nr:hemerythrin family protein [Rhodospirillales bacterium]
MSVAFRFGIQQIDDEHNYINHLLEKLDANQDGPHAPELVGGVLADLHDHTIHHFRCEEKLMEVAGYPGIEEHAQDHQKLVMRIDDLLEQSTTKPGQSLGHDIIDIIISGLIMHTDVLDRRFYNWFSDKGWKTEDIERFRSLIDANSKDAPKNAGPTQ